MRPYINWNLAPINPTKHEIHLHHRNALAVPKYSEVMVSYDLYSLLVFWQIDAIFYSLPYYYVDEGDIFASNYRG